MATVVTKPMVSPISVDRQVDQVTSETWVWVYQRLHEDWAPEQVSTWLVGNAGVPVSHEWAISMRTRIDEQAVSCIATYGVRSRAESGTGAMRPPRLHQRESVH